MGRVPCLAGGTIAVCMSVCLPCTRVSLARLREQHTQAEADNGARLDGIEPTEQINKSTHLLLPLSHTHTLLASEYCQREGEKRGMCYISSDHQTHPYAINGGEEEEADDDDDDQRGEGTHHHRQVIRSDCHHWRGEIHTHTSTQTEGGTDTITPSENEQDYEEKVARKLL